MSVCYVCLCLLIKMVSGMSVSFKSVNGVPPYIFLINRLNRQTNIIVRARARLSVVAGQP